MHTNSLDDFYIRMESDVDVFKSIEKYIDEVPELSTLPASDVRIGKICIARNMEEMLMYRARILRAPTETTKALVEAVMPDCSNARHC